MDKMNPRTARRGLLAAGVVAATAAATGARAQQGSEANTDKVVYHINDAAAQATSALRNIRNHLDDAPGTKIVVVAHANGVDFLMNDATDQKNPNIDYPSLVSALTARGVHFEVCRNTMERRQLEESDFVMDAEFVQSGVARVGQLQCREHYAYLKP